VRTGPHFFRRCNVTLRLCAQTFFRGRADAGSAVFSGAEKEAAEAVGGRPRKDEQKPPLKTAEVFKLDRSGESHERAAKLAAEAGIPNIDQRIEVVIQPLSLHLFSRAFSGVKSKYVVDDARGRRCRP
jgi:hypothetical protein